MIDRLYGWLSGWMLLQLVKRAMKRGDVHEARHCTEALTRGNSDDCIPSACRLDRSAIAAWDAAFRRDFLRGTSDGYDA